MVAGYNHILYLCNGKNPYCKIKSACGRCVTEESPDHDLCFHTTNPEYAINGPYFNEETIDIRPYFWIDDQNNAWEGCIGYGKKRLQNI